MSELRQLCALEDEKARLKRLVADLSLDKHILTEALRQKVEACTAPRVGRLGADHLRSLLRAGLSVGAVHARGVVSTAWRSEQTTLRHRIGEIAQQRPRFGYLRIWVDGEGWMINTKRVRRVYRGARGASGAGLIFGARS